MTKQKIIELLSQKAGVALEYVGMSGGTHIKVRTPQGALHHVASTPGDKRGFLNKAAEIRRTERNLIEVKAKSSK